MRLAESMTCWTLQGLVPRAESAHLEMEGAEPPSHPYHPPQSFELGSTGLF